MPTPYLLLRPEVTGYSATPGSEVVAVPLEGGKAFYRRDKLNAAWTVTVQWVLTKPQYEYFWAFYRSQLVQGSLSFNLDLITDRGTVERHLCHFAPNTVPRLTQQMGLAYWVQADLEVEAPYLDAARNLKILEFQEQDFGLLVRLKFHQDVFSNYGSAAADVTQIDPQATLTVDDVDRGRVYLNGSSDNGLEVEGNIFPEVSSYTIMTWIKRPTGPGTDVMWDMSGTPTLRFFINDSGISGGHGSTAVSASTSLVNTWHHVAATWDADTGDMVLYVNAQPVDTATSVTAYGAPVDTFRIGGNGSSDGTIGFYDDARVYNKVLSQNEIESIYEDTLVVPFTVNNPGP